MAMAFYSLQDTWTPAAVAIVSVGINIGLSLWLMAPLGHTGLALATGHRPHPHPRRHFRATSPRVIMANIRRVPDSDRNRAASRDWTLCLDGLTSLMAGSRARSAKNGMVVLST